MSIQEIKTRINNAATEAGRSADDISLIAVSKVQPNARVLAVLETGHTTFGEKPCARSTGQMARFPAEFWGIGFTPDWPITNE